MSKPCPLFGKAIYLDCLEYEEKLCKMNKRKKYDKIVIGIDQSYKDTGISIAADGILKAIRHIPFSKIYDNSSKRKKLSDVLEKALIQSLKKSNEVVVICERIRLRSEGFLDIDYIKSTGALNATIVDTAYKYGVKVYSVDTRSWKSQVVGTSKPMKNKYGVDPKKWPTILHIKELGYLENILDADTKKKKGVIELNGERYFINDNAADSACIALYGFIAKSDQKLEEEH